MQTLPQLLPTAEMGTAQQETDVFFVILNGQQHSAHFSKEEADSVAFDLSVEHNYESHPEECGYSEISVLSFMEMMESPVEMVL